MTVAEPPCYTLINTGQDAEPPSEMQLREDLEKGNDKVSSFVHGSPVEEISPARPKLKR